LRLLRAFGAVCILLILVPPPSWAAAQTPTEKPEEITPAPAPSKFRSADDGWLDVSGFLDEKYGFLPIAIPITEPAVGYGAAGALAFLSQPLGEARAGFGRPDITIAGGLGTENGSWGLLAGDIRHWFDDRIETQAGITHLSVNLDFHGIGQDARLDNHPLRYNLEPTGGVVRAKYRLGDSTFWLGLGYAFAATRVTFEAPAGTPGLPEFRRNSNVGGLTPSFTYDTRDNLFTPLRGSFVELVVGVFSPVLGGDDDFQRLQLTAMQYVPCSPRCISVCAATVPRPSATRRFISGRSSVSAERRSCATRATKWPLSRWSSAGSSGDASAWWVSPAPGLRGTTRSAFTTRRRSSRAGLGFATRSRASTVFTWVWI